MKKVINGLSVTDSGSNRPPLLFVHAFPLNSEMWIPQFEFFKDNFRVITYDVRGLGASTSDTELFFMEDYADDLIFIINNLGLKDINAVGLSMGGYIIQRTMVKEPSLFKTVTLADTKGEKDTDEGLLNRYEIVKKIRSGKRKEVVSDLISRLISVDNYKNSELVRKLENIISLNTDRGICGAVNALATRTSTLHKIASMTIPALILVGEYDLLTPVKASEDLAKSLINSELQIIKNSGHLSNLENTSDFNTLLNEFLKRKCL